MKALIDFCKKLRPAVWWTVCYAFIMWAILKFMFNFDMFSRAYWVHLFHAQLIGFGGFVFGLLILAAIPIYIATTSIVFRTGTPFIKCPIKTPSTDILKKMFAGPVMTQDAPAPAPEQKPEPTPTPEPVAESTPAPEPAPTQISRPREMAAAFARAAQNIGPKVTSALNAPTPATKTANTATTPEPIDIDTNPGDLPLPTDFDFDDMDADQSNPFSGDSPMFTDISFGDDTPSPDSTSEQTPAPSTPKNNDTIKQLAEQGHKIISSEPDLIVTDRVAIAIHDSPDFWVTDSDFWFATGAQKPSPIRRAMDAATEHGVKPVLYLIENNIMDIDNCKKQWESDGITVIGTIDEIPE